LTGLTLLRVDKEVGFLSTLLYFTLSTEKSSHLVTDFVITAFGRIFDVEEKLEY